MATRGIEIWPQEMQTGDRNIVKEVSVSIGHEERQAVDMDARTLALLGKKQRLEVS